MMRFSYYVKNPQQAERGILSPTFAPQNIVCPQADWQA